jgi:hypothetical protein
LGFDCVFLWWLLRVHIRFFGNGYLGCRAYSESLGRAPSNQGLLPLSFGASPRLGMPSLRRLVGARKSKAKQKRGGLPAGLALRVFARPCRSCRVKRGCDLLICFLQARSKDRSLRQLLQGMGTSERDWSVFRLADTDEQKLSGIRRCSSPLHSPAEWRRCPRMNAGAKEPRALASRKGETISRRYRSNGYVHHQQGFHQLSAM